MYFKNYFICANTAQGFVELTESNLQGIKRICFLKGESLSGKTYILKKILKYCAENGIGAEISHFPLNPDMLDGVIIPDLNFAAIAPCKNIEAEQTLAAKTFDIDKAYDFSKIKENCNRVTLGKEIIGKCCQNAYKSYAKALLIHDEWEKIYIGNMDYNAADRLAENTVGSIIRNNFINKTPVEKHRFFGAGTPKGPVNYIDNLTLEISKRYLLKGRPGTGKSTLLKKIASVAKIRGLDTEIYHCGFDFNSLDMVLLKEINVCIFDSTAPHLFEPSRHDDEIIDMYKECVTPGTDSKYEKELNEISAKYKLLIQNGTKHLLQAEKLLSHTDNIYSQAADYNIIDSYCEDIIESIKT